MKSTVICLIVMCLAPVFSLAQAKAGQLVWQAKEVKMQTGLRKNLVKFSPDYKGFNKDELTSIQSGPHQKSLPADFYNQQLGWVCRQEWKLEKKTSIPFKLRLGSVEQVNYLEGKHPSTPGQHPIF